LKLVLRGLDANCTRSQRRRTIEGNRVA
jgi:hypothetical protein